MSKSSKSIRRSVAIANICLTVTTIASGAVALAYKDEEIGEIAEYTGYASAVALGLGHIYQQVQVILDCNESQAKKVVENSLKSYDEEN